MSLGKLCPARLSLSRQNVQSDIKTLLKRRFWQFCVACWPAKSLSRATKGNATSGPAHWSQVRSRITTRIKTTTKNNLCAPRELHADRCASSDTAQVAYSIIPRETVGPIYIIKLEKLNDYGRICLADWRAVLYDHQGRPPTPHTPIPLTLAPIISSPTTHGAMRTRRSTEVGKPGSLSSNYVWLVHPVRQKHTGLWKTVWMA